MIENNIFAFIEFQKQRRCHDVSMRFHNAGLAAKSGAENQIRILQPFERGNLHFSDFLLTPSRHFGAFQWHTAS
jgi:hypothetical protein